MSKEPKPEPTWAVLYRNEEGTLKVVECYSEREAIQKARALQGTYQMIDG